MNTKIVCLGLLLLASCLMVSARVGGVRRVRLVHGDYDCSCTYHCPSYYIQGGRCYGDDDYWGWGRVARYCCYPSAHEELYSRDSDYIYGPHGVYYNSKK